MSGSVWMRLDARAFCMLLFMSEVVPTQVIAAAQRELATICAREPKMSDNAMQSTLELQKSVGLFVVRGNTTHRTICVNH